MPTKRRIFRVANAIHKRQTDIIFALESVHDPHNMSAILRSADATGIVNVIWQPEPEGKTKINPEVSLGTERWVELNKTNDLKTELIALKNKGFRIAATHLSENAVDFRQIDWTEPWAVVMGNEQRGCSIEVTSIADQNIFLPMAGFVQSLNVSVASAVIMYEIQRQRQMAGMYTNTKPYAQIKKLYEQWGLQKDGYAIEDLLKPPSGDLPDFEMPFDDGRSKNKV